MLLTKLAKNVAVRSSRARQSGRPSNMMLLRQGLSSSRLSTGLSRKPKKTLFSTTIHGQSTTKRDLVTRYQMSPKGGHASRLKWLALTCPSFMLANNLFPSLFRQWDSLPEFITAFGLFPEPEGWREWQSVLDSRTLPGITRSFSCDLAVFYTDGACLFPRHPVIRVASGAVLRANVDGTFQVCWHGALPGSCQSIFRAELLAVACAVGMANKPVVFTDSQSVCRTANRILRQLQAGNPPGLPQDNKDLWAFFLSNLDSVHISWIKRSRQLPYCGWFGQNSCLVQPLG